MSRNEHQRENGRLDAGLAAALRPGGAADAGPHHLTVDGAALTAGARSRAGVIRRRRAAGVSAAAVGALVAVTLGVVPGLLAPREALPAASPAPTLATVPVPVPVPTAPEPSAPEPSTAEPSAPLQRSQDGFLLVPDDASPAPGALPTGLTLVGGLDGPSGAFLQNVAASCTEQVGTLLGEGFVGSRTWTYAGPDTAADEPAISAELRVDVHDPGLAETAVDVLSERASQCLDTPGNGIASLGTEAPLRPGAQDTVVVAGSVEADPDAPEGSAPGSSAVLVVTNAGDVVVRALVTSRGGGAEDGTGRAEREAAEQLVAAALGSVESSGLPERLAAGR